MRYIVLHYFWTGALLLVIVWFKLHELGQLLVTIIPASRTHERVLDRIGKSILGMLAVALMLDPLIPGVAVVEIHVPPERIVTTLDHLAVRVMPVGLLGAAGGSRTSVVGISERSVASVVVQLHLLESSLNIDLLDESRPDPVVQQQTVYISPFVRRQVWILRVSL